MSRRYDLFVLDIDGTFLTSRKQPSEAVLAALREARAEGVRIAFATGRMFEAIAGWVADLGLDTPQIANNGADLVDPHSAERLFSQYLSPAAVAWLVEQGQVAELPTVLFAGTRVLAEATVPEHWLLERNNEHVSIVPRAALLDPALTVEKLLFLAIDRAAELPSVRDRLKAVAADRFQAEMKETGILNFCHPLANKGQAVTHLATRLDIPLARVAAIGDGDNDVAMLTTVGLGIAMGNASPAALAAAHVTVADNDHDGLADAVYTHILG